MPNHWDRRHSQASGRASRRGHSRDLGRSPWLPGVRRLGRKRGRGPKGGLLEEDPEWEEDGGFGQSGRFHKPPQDCVAGWQLLAVGVGVPTTADCSLGLAACSGKRTTQLGKPPDLELGVHDSNSVQNWAHQDWLWTLGHQLVLTPVGPPEKERAWAGAYCPRPPGPKSTLCRRPNPSASRLGWPSRPGPTHPSPRPHSPECTSPVCPSHCG